MSTERKCSCLRANTLPLHTDDLWWLLRSFSPYSAPAPIKVDGHFVWVRGFRIKHGAKHISEKTTDYKQYWNRNWKHNGFRAIRDCKRNCSKIIADAEKLLVWQNVQCLNAFSLSEVAVLFQHYLDGPVNQSTGKAHARTCWICTTLTKGMFRQHTLWGL